MSSACGFPDVGEKDANFALKPIQNIAVHRFSQYMQGTKGVFLLHNVGSGKTITSLTIALNSFDNWDNKGSKRDIIVIHPTGLFLNFHNDLLEKIPNIIFERCEIEAGNKRKKKSYYKKTFGPNPAGREDKARQFTITSRDYSTLKTDYYDIAKAPISDERVLSFKEFFRDKVIIFDEVHRLFRKIDPTSTDPEAPTIIDFFIKNNIMEHAKRLIIMSGTPLNSSLEDIAKMLCFLNSGVPDDHKIDYSEDPNPRGVRVVDDFNFSKASVKDYFVYKDVDTFGMSAGTYICISLQRFMHAVTWLWHRNDTHPGIGGWMSSIRSGARIDIDDRYKVALKGWCAPVFIPLSDINPYVRGRNERLQIALRSLLGITASGGGAMSISNAKKIFGLEENVSKEELKKKYKELALQRHPDRSKKSSNEATRNFQNLQEAYTILSNMGTNESETFLLQDPAIIDYIFQDFVDIESLVNLLHQYTLIENYKNIEESISSEFIFAEMMATPPEIYIELLRTSIFTLGHLNPFSVQKIITSIDKRAIDYCIAKDKLEIDRITDSINAYAIHNSEPLFIKNIKSRRQVGGAIADLIPEFLRLPEWHTNVTATTTNVTEGVQALTPNMTEMPDPVRNFISGIVGNVTAEGFGEWFRTNGTTMLQRIQSNGELYSRPMRDAAGNLLTFIAGGLGINPSVVMWIGIVGGTLLLFYFSEFIFGLIGRFVSLIWRFLTGTVYSIIWLFRNISYLFVSAGIILSNNSTSVFRRWANFFSEQIISGDKTLYDAAFARGENALAATLRFQLESINAFDPINIEIFSSRAKKYISIIDTTMHQITPAFNQITGDTDFSASDRVECDEENSNNMDYLNIVKRKSDYIDYESLTDVAPLATVGLKHTNLKVIEEEYTKDKLMLEPSEKTNYPTKNIEILYINYTPEQSFFYSEIHTIYDNSINCRSPLFAGIVPWYIANKIKDDSIVGNYSQDVRQPCGKINASSNNTQKNLVAYNITNNKYELKLNPPVPNLTFDCPKFQKLLNHLIFMKTGLMYDSSEEGKLRKHPHLIDSTKPDATITPISREVVEGETIIPPALDVSKKSFVENLGKDDQPTHGWLPFVYSTSEELGLNLFAQFLTAKGYSYILLHEDTPDDPGEQRKAYKTVYPLLNQEEMRGRTLTDSIHKFLTEEYQGPANNIEGALHESGIRKIKKDPICVLLHKFRTEGIDAKHTPAIFLMDPPVNYGDYEQLCGRILRTYSRTYDSAPVKMVYPFVCHTTKSIKNLVETYDGMEATPYNLKYNDIGSVGLFFKTDSEYNVPYSYTFGTLIRGKIPILERKESLNYAAFQSIRDKNRHYASNVPELLSDEDRVLLLDPTLYRNDTIRRKIADKITNVQRLRYRLDNTRAYFNPTLEIYNDESNRNEVENLNKIFEQYSIDMTVLRIIVNVLRILKPVGRKLKEIDVAKSTNITKYIETLQFHDGDDNIKFTVLGCDIESYKIIKSMEHYFLKFKAGLLGEGNPDLDAIIEYKNSQPVARQQLIELSPWCNEFNISPHEACILDETYIMDNSILPKLNFLSCKINSATTRDEMIENIKNLKALYNKLGINIKSAIEQREEASAAATIRASFANGGPGAAHAARTASAAAAVRDPLIRTTSAQTGPRVPATATAVPLPTSPTVIPEQERLLTATEAALAGMNSRIPAVRSPGSGLSPVGVNNNGFIEVRHQKPHGSRKQQVPASRAPSQPASSSKKGPKWSRGRSMRKGLPNRLSRGGSKTRKNRRSVFHDTIKRKKTRRSVFLKTRRN